MPRYLCPICKRNTSRFELRFYVSQVVHFDPESGTPVWESDELELAHRSGQPQVEIKCLECGYSGAERLFSKAARAPLD